MIVTYTDIRPYIEYLNYNIDINNSFDGLCSSKLYRYMDSCINCKFNNKLGTYNQVECKLANDNHHLSQLLKTLQQLHPELFI